MKHLPSVPKVLQTAKHCYEKTFIRDSELCLDEDYLIHIGTHLPARLPT